MAVDLISWKWITRTPNYYENHWQALSVSGDKETGKAILEVRLLVASQGANLRALNFGSWKWSFLDFLFFSFHVKFRTRLYVSYLFVTQQRFTSDEERIFSVLIDSNWSIVLTSQDTTQCLIQEVDFSHNLEFSMNIKQTAIQSGTKYHGLLSAWQPCVAKPEFKYIHT